MAVVGSILEQNRVNLSINCIINSRILKVDIIIITSLNSSGVEPFLFCKIAKIGANGKWVLKI